MIPRSMALASLFMASLVAASSISREAANLPPGPPPPGAPASQEASPPVDGASNPSMERRIQSSTLGRLLLSESADAELLQWNRLIPSTIPEWIELLDGGTDSTSGLLIPFSMAPQFTSLESPRIVLTAPEGSPERGRLFVGVPGEQADVEFISWNAERLAFDFGTIETREGMRRVSFANEASCFACHRTRSPIFPEASWDNTALNRSVLAAFIEHQAEQDRPGFKQLNQKFLAMIERDEQARRQTPPALENFIDNQLASDESRVHRDLQRLPLRGCGCHAGVRLQSGHLRRSLPGGLGGLVADAPQSEPMPPGSRTMEKPIGLTITHSTTSPWRL